MSNSDEKKNLVEYINKEIINPIFEHMRVERKHMEDHSEQIIKALEARIRDMDAKIKNLLEKTKELETIINNLKQK